MPDRFWVGGTASWDGTAGTKWSAASGGPGGASVPTTADDVFFTNLSTGTCTIATGNTGARSINCTGFAGTIAGSAEINVAGSVTLVPAMTYTHSGRMNFTGTGTLTTAGKTFSSVFVNGAGITLTLGDALNTAARDIGVTVGTFNTANFNVTAQTFSSANANTRSITLGSSTITLGGNFNISVSTNLTFSAGTSLITLSNANAGFFGGNQTFHNVNFSSTSTGQREITGANTFNNLTLTASATGLSRLAISTSSQTVNGTFTCAGASVTQRGFVAANPPGNPRTITANAISANDCDFQDITLAGAAAGASPTRAGNCGGNSGITFPAAKTVFWNLAGTQNWNATAWATTSTGTPAVNNFPLVQDTATFTDGGAAGTVSLSTVDYNLGSLDLSGRTSGMTLNHNGVPNIYGNYILGSGVGLTGTFNQFFVGRGTQTFTSAGKTIPFSVRVDKFSGAFELGDAFVSSVTTNSLVLTRGTFEARNFNVTCAQFVSSISNTRTITMGSGLWTLTGSALIWSIEPLGLTLNRGTANILLSNTTTSSRTFNGGGLTYNRLTIGGATGTSTLTIGGANTFSELASTKTVAHTIQLFGSGTTIGTWSITGTPGNVVTFNSGSPGTQRTFNLTNSTAGLIDYLSVRDIGVNQANRFYVGNNSTNGGNNINVLFSSGPVTSATGNFFMLFS